MASFTLAATLHCDRVEFLRRGEGSRTREGSGHFLDYYSAGAQVHCRTFADFSGFLSIMDYLLRSAAYRLC